MLGIFLLVGFLRINLKICNYYEPNQPKYEVRNNYEIVQLLSYFILINQIGFHDGIVNTLQQISLKLYKVLVLIRYLKVILQP